MISAPFCGKMGTTVSAYAMGLCRASSVETSNTAKGKGVARRGRGLCLWYRGICWPSGGSGRPSAGRSVARTVHHRKEWQGLFIL